MSKQERMPFYKWVNLARGYNISEDIIIDMSDMTSHEFYANSMIIARREPGPIGKEIELPDPGSKHRKIVVY